MSRKINCDQLKFALYPHATDMKMFQSYYRNGKWDRGTITDFHTISLSPAANILNYGQGIFEGLKAYYSQKGQVVMFRPRENARRFERSAKKLAIPDISSEIFLEAVFSVVKANLNFIPKSYDGKCSLYIRPVCIATEAQLGVRAAQEFLFYIYCSPVGPYFDRVGVIRLIVKEVNRASPHGTGDAKAVCNYPVTMAPKKEAISQGFNDVVYLDAVEGRFIEEGGAANFFALLDDNTLVTPPLGSILPGITRDSTLQLAGEIFGMKTEERNLSVEEVVENARECFVTGTAAVITSVSEIGWKGKTFNVNKNDFQLARQLYEKLVGIQLQKEEDPFGWVTVLDV